MSLYRSFLYFAFAHAGSGTVVPSLTTITSKYGTISAVQNQDLWEDVYL